MEANWAAEHLQVIRTLMERSALYRRALAPLMLYGGMLGVISAVIGLVLHLNSMRSFAGLWLCTAIAAVAGSFLVARRQAFKEKEAFWSPPTRRVAHAVSPPLFCGMCLGVILALAGAGDEFVMVLAFLWILFYGCALHAAGFFMPRGMKLFGWLFIAMAIGILVISALLQPGEDLSAHWLMGFFFGILQLGYAGYLYLTAKAQNVA